MFVHNRDRDAHRALDLVMLGGFAVNLGEEVAFEVRGFALLDALDRRRLVGGGLEEFMPKLFQ